VIGVEKYFGNTIKTWY